MKSLAVAPMLDWTDTYFRQFIRCFSKHAELYTEMIHCTAIIKGNTNKLLQFNHCEKPLILQLGGNNPVDFVHCAQIAEEFQFSGININVGCPSCKTTKAQFGAILMQEPELVAEIVNKMHAVTTLPISIKTRIGIDDMDSLDFVINFINKTSQAGCQKYIFHARKALLNGINPKQNRKIPPINYQRVYQIKQCFPHLNIIINGEINQIDKINNHLNQVEGIMIGRKIFRDPLYLKELNDLIFEEKIDINSLYEQIDTIITKQLNSKISYHHIAPYFLSLFHNFPNAKQYRIECLQLLEKNQNNLNQIKPFILDAISYRFD